MMNEKEYKIYQDIMYKLTPIVSDYITGYKTDFTVYDIPEIINTIQAGSKLFWFIRPKGTHILKCRKDVTLQNAMKWQEFENLKEYNKRVFLIDGESGNVEELTNEIMDK